MTESALVIGGVTPSDLTADLAKALDKTDFVISLEVRRGEVSEYADVVLPVAPGMPVSYAGMVVIVVAVLSSILTILYAFQQDGWRELLSFSSAENGSIAVAMLGVIAGNPITVWVLGRAKTPEPAEHGGIVVASEHGDKTKREVLRGGWLIGYLERLAIVAAVVLGRFEIVAAVIAVKGLGRFSELDNAAARERFIIGTLTSIIWAGTCALLIVSANS